MATRAALGAGATRAIRQVLTESLVLGVFGTIAGLAVAFGCLSFVSPFISESFLIGQHATLDWRVLSLSAGLAVITGIAFGLLPALDIRRMNLRGALGESGGHVTGARGATRLRRLFVVAEVFLAAVLLIGAGLFVRTIASLTNVDLGFDAAHVIAAQVSIQGTSTGGAQERNALFERVLQRIRELPAVEAAAIGSNVPVERAMNLAIEAAGLVRETRAMDWMYISPEYFSVFRIPIRAGRGFNARVRARRRVSRW
jgi:hypothetical protein